MNVSVNCITLIKLFESCKLESYPDIKNIPTIGWGHTQNVKLGMTCTQEQADQWFKEDLRVFECQVIRALNADEIDVTQYQLDSLVCFAYNLGTYTLVHGSKNASITKIGQLWQALKIGDLISASKKFLLYTNKGVRGLVIRRTAESMLFQGKDIKEIVEWVKQSQQKK